MRVLIVEDDMSRVKKFRRHLIGHSVVHCTTADQAKDKMIWEKPFDIVFLDFDLHYQTDLEPAQTGNGLMVAHHIAHKVSYAPFIVIHSYNKDGHGAIASTLKRAGYERYVHAAGAWKEEEAIEALMNSGRWPLPPHLPEFTAEYGW